MKAPQITYFLLLAIAGLTSAAPTGFGTAMQARNFFSPGCGLFSPACEKPTPPHPPPPPPTSTPTPTEIRTAGDPQESLIVPLGPGPVIFPQS
ncbi:hypothetical protein DL96DRAFT_1614409 [Flagelloscypha sp. PMI_526]|nr:hypothetical protein DL96DRAFT_1614409 [Flagelloscypha sp. PMI_526]